MNWLPWAYNNSTTNLQLRNEWNEYNLARNGTKHIGFTTKLLKTNERVDANGSKRDQINSNGSEMHCIGFESMQNGSNFMKTRRIFSEWNPKVSINPRWLWSASNWSYWCSTAPNRSKIQWIGSVSAKWSGIWKFGLEFGSAGPIWMRLLFVSPDPILMVML